MQWSLYGMSYITISCIFGSSTMLTGGWYIERKCPLLEFVRNIHIWPRLENFNFWGKSQSQLYSIKPERSLIFLLPFEIETNSVDFVLRPKNRRANIVEEGLYRLKPVLRLSTTWSKNSQQNRAKNNRLYIRGTQREYGSKPHKHSIVKRILVFKR